MEGKIIKGIGGFYYIKTEEGLIECKARGKFRHKDITPMVGDNVTIKIENGKGVIEEIHERKSKFISGFLTAKTINASETFATVGLANSDFRLCISSMTPFPFSISIVTLSPTIGFISLCLNLPLALHSIKPSSVLI